MKNNPALDDAMKATAKAQRGLSWPEMDRMNNECHGTAAGLVNRIYFGWVPRDFNERLGTSKTHGQRQCEKCGLWMWVKR